LWIAHTGDAIRVPYLRRLTVVAVAVVNVLIMMVMMMVGWEQDF